VKTFKQFQEAALAIPAAGFISKFLPAAAATIGAAGTIMQIKDRAGGNRKKIKGRIGGQSPEVKQNHMTPRQRRTMEAQGLIPKQDPLKNNQGPGLKPGSGTKPGGKWDKLPKGQSSNWSKGNNLTGIANEVQKNQNKIKLKDFIKKKYGNKDQLTGGTLPEEMMGAGAIANNVGDGKIAGTVEAGDDPPVKKKKKSKKKKRYVYGGKGSRKMWLT
jgi:hypothetical protein